MTLSKYQLERADLLSTIEQGRRVETELFAENSRGLRTMGELLKARLFGSTQWAINLRKRMTNYVEGGSRSSRTGAAGSPARNGAPSTDVQGGQGQEEGTRSLGEKPATRVTTPPEPHQKDAGYHYSGRVVAEAPEPHQWPCGDPYCQPCDDAVKRLLRDVGVLPRKGGTR
jgi:hypothetical protein